MPVEKTNVKPTAHAFENFIRTNLRNGYDD
jgi:hypothetical protein